jgi:molybdate transport system permease protein
MKSDRSFFWVLGLIGGSYVALIVSLLAADAAYTSGSDFLGALRNREIRYAIKLSLISCGITAILSVWVAVPLGYLLARTNFWGKRLVDALVDVPIVLPPLVIGLSLLILFQTTPGRLVERVIPISYAVPGVILAQFAVACAFAVRTMRTTFEQIAPRREKVALTLGCSRSQAFWRIVLPEAWRGVITAGTVAWARALGEFGPVLVFAAATPMRTEVLPTAVFLELSVGNLRAALAVSMLMVLAAIVVLLVVRVYGVGRVG